jgi:hypothetical protein
MISHRKTHNGYYANLRPVEIEFSARWSELVPKGAGIRVGEVLDFTGMEFKVEEIVTGGGPRHPQVRLRMLGNIESSRERERREADEARRRAKAEEGQG